MQRRGFRRVLDRTSATIRTERRSSVASNCFLHVTQLHLSRSAPPVAWAGAFPGRGISGGDQPVRSAAGEVVPGQAASVGQDQADSRALRAGGGSHHGRGRCLKSTCAA